MDFDRLRGYPVHRQSDSNVAMAIFQADRGRDPFIQVCAHEIWLECAHQEMTLGVSHTHREALEGSVDSLSCWHLVQVYRDREDKVVQDN